MNKQHENRIWFISRQGVNTGPHTKQEVESLIASSTDPEIMIWGRGRGHWSTPNEWRTQFVEAGASSVGSDDLWFISIDGIPGGPLTRTELIARLRAESRNVSTILLRAESQVRWLEGKHFPEILTQAGIAAFNGRAAIIGDVEIECEGKKITGRLNDIGEHGLGVKNLLARPFGDVFKVTIQSPSLQGNIIATATLAHFSADGRAGLKFESLFAEMRAQVVEYVENFEKIKRRSIEIGNGSRLEPIES